ncbi:MAG TPA: archaemetzincin [Planctomycetota bacterium]|nr:archaemetzincin [Planctomycetota bacterium]
MSARDPELLPPPRRGEWRSIVKELEQTCDEYVLRCSNRKTATRSTLVLQPLGDVDRRHAALLGRLRDYGDAFFGLETRIAAALPLTDAAHVPQREQHNSSMILDDLAGRLPDGALIYLGIADRDLFARGKKYVFGEGDLERRTGVLSLSRLETPEADLFLRRALRLMSHEAGHILSIAHCVKRRCLMQGSNTLAESDAQPLHLCREDLRKLEWNTRHGGTRRERALRDFYAGLGWENP